MPGRQGRVVSGFRLRRWHIWLPPLAAGTLEFPDMSRADADTLEAELFETS